MADTGKTIGLIKALASVDPEAIKSSVDDWLDDHPEATTTVEDGAITKAKLDSSLQQTVDDVGDLKSAVKTLDGTDDGVITPRFFPESIVGKYGETITSTYTDGYWVNNQGNVNQGANFSIQETSVTVGEKYIIRPYQPMTTGAYGVFEDGSGVVKGIVKDNSTLVPDTDHDYIVTVPTGATKMLVNVKPTDKQDVRLVYSQNTNVYLPAWMKEDVSSIWDAIHTLSQTNPGVITPKLFANSIAGQYGKTLLSEYTDGYYINNNGNMAALNTVSVQETAIRAGMTYIIRTYTAISGNSVYGIIKNSSGDIIGLVRNYTELVPDTTRDYYFTAPANAATMFVNVSKSDKLPVREYYLTDSPQYLPPWFVRESGGGTTGDIYVKNVQTLHSYTIIKKPIVFSGKNVTIFGDSIARGYASNPTQVLTNPWIKQFCDRAGATYDQQAIAGSTFATGVTEFDSVYEKVNAYTGEPDIIIIAAGTNDYSQNETIGTYTDNVSTTLYGALNLICAKLSVSHPNADVIFITPINRSNISTQENVEKLNNYRNAIFEIAMKNGHSVIEGSLLGFPMETGSYQETVLYDNLHPTEIGHAMYANAVSGLLL